MSFKLSTQERKKILDVLPTLEISYVLEGFGATLDGSRWRITGEGVDNGAFEIREKTEDGKSPFAANNEFWCDYKEGGRGYGAFNLIKYLLGKNNKEDNDYVLAFIKENFFDENYELKITNINSEFSQLSTGSRVPKGYFDPPERFDEYLNEGVEYLNKARGIPLEVIMRNMDNGDAGQIYTTKLYQDIRVVFKGRFNGEWRSIYGTGKKACEGSMRNISGYEAEADTRLLQFETDEDGYKTIKKNTGYFAITEAAIDALSYNALFPDRFVVSTNGCGNFELQYRKVVGYLDSDMGISIRCAMDSDYAGDEASQKLFNAIYFRTLLCKGKTYGPLLKEHFKDLITEEDPDGWKKGVDEWFLNGEIGFSIYNSPHLLFFNNPFYSEKYEVYPKTKSRSGEMSEEEKETYEIEEKEITYSEPKILIKLSKTVADLLNINQNAELKVSQKNFESLTKEILVRERPLGYNDWNEMLKAQGVPYHFRYTELSEKNFIEVGKITLPEVNDSKSLISVFRDRNILSNPKNVEILKKYYSTTTVVESENVLNSTQVNLPNQEQIKQNPTISERNVVTNTLSMKNTEDYQKYLEIKNNRLTLFKRFNDNIDYLYEETRFIQEINGGPESQQDLKKQYHIEDKRNQVRLKNLNDNHNQEKNVVDNIQNNKPNKQIEIKNKVLEEKTASNLREFENQGRKVQQRRGLNLALSIKNKESNVGTRANIENKVEENNSRNKMVENQKQEILNVSAGNDRNNQMIEKQSEISKSMTNGNNSFVEYQSDFEAPNYSEEDYAMYLAQREDEELFIAEYHYGEEMGQSLSLADFQKMHGEPVNERERRGLKP